MFRATMLSIAALLICCPTLLAAEPEAVALFDGKSLDGWDSYLVEDDVAMADVWSVKDGILVCKGEPMGYLYTKEKFENFKLIVEWRWAPGGAAGNSGVLLRITGEHAPLPRCVEGQLKHNNAGDVWAFKGFKCTGPAERFREVENAMLGKFVGVQRADTNEKAPGQWNKYEITIKDDALTLIVNGKQLNHVTGCDQVAGHIGLQSEGGEIQFRTVKLIPLD